MSVLTIPLAIHNKMFNSLAVNAAVDPLWFEQKLDHFNESDDRVWKQRYYTNFDHYQPGGPIFIYIGGEGPLTSGTVGPRLVPGYFAEKYGGAAIALEHRFYGESQPFPSLDLKHLLYLTSHQALHDLAAWQKWITHNSNLTDSKFFCVGGSYPGNLAAWYRGEFPELTAGCWAASAPVHAVYDWPEYGQMVWKSLSTMPDGGFDETLTTKLYAGFQQISLMLQNPFVETIPELQAEFNVCPGTMASVDDKANWDVSISGAVAGAVQYNHLISPGTNDIRAAVANSATPLAAALAVNKLIGTTKPPSEGGCVDKSLGSFYADLANATLPADGSGNANRAWLWQTCNEFGYYQTADGAWNEHNFFTAGASNAAVAYGFCKDVFGIDDTKARIAATNEYYGGLTPKSRRGGYVSNVFFSNGALDPWSLLGITERRPEFCESCRSMVGAQGSHCVGLYGPSEGELASQIEIRNFAEKLFEQWGASSLVV